MNPTRFLRPALAGLVIALASSGALAAALQFNDAAAYQASLPGSSSAIDGFEDLTPDGNLLLGPLLRGQGAQSYRVSSTADANGDGLNELFLLSSLGSSTLSTNFFGSDLVFDLLGSGVRGVGGLFFLTDIDGGVRSGTVSLRITDVQGGISDFVLNSGLAPRFVGFVSELDIASLQLASVGDSQWLAVDQFQLDGVAAAVPEPALAGLGLSLFGLGLMALKRKQR